MFALMLSINEIGADITEDFWEITYSKAHILRPQQ
jgi:hypothetical protein